MSKTAKPKKRINRFVYLLSKIYEIDYKITKRIYEQFQDDDDRFKQNLEATKYKLKLMQQNQNELNFIDTINLNF